MQTDHGIFLSFDGVPRSGRTYQANALATSLVLDGHDVLRLSMPPDPVPLAKTSLPWLYGRLSAYNDLITREAIPALEAGGVVILDGGVTSLLIRARAVLGANAPIGFLHLFDQRANRLAPVDIEWIIGTSRQGERATPGFNCVSHWGIAACAAAPAASFTPMPACGARRHSTYFLTAATIERETARLPDMVAYLMSERKGPAWERVVAETSDERDLAVVRYRMAQWVNGDTMPLYGVVANWGSYTEATRMAVVEALPARQGTAREFLAALSATGAAPPAGAVGEALAVLMEGETKEEAMAG
jgi:hypothetical protein